MLFVVECRFLLAVFVCSLLLFVVRCLVSVDRRPLIVVHCLLFCIVGVCCRLLCVVVACFIVVARCSSLLFAV